MPEVGNLEWLAMDVRTAPQPPQLWPISVAIDTRCPASKTPAPNARASAPLTRGAARAQIKNPDKGPTLRTGHSLVVSGLPNNPKAVIIGGCTAEGVVNEVWNLKLGVETLEWEKPKIGQPDKAPSPRWRHTANLLRASPRARPTTPTTPRRCALS